MEAKGRNGVFKVNTIDVDPIRTTVVGGKKEPLICISFFAKNSSWKAPAYIEGTRAEMLALCRKILLKCFDDVELTTEVFIASITANAQEGEKEEKL